MNDPQDVLNDAYAKAESASETIPTLTAADFERADHQHAFLRLDLDPLGVYGGLKLQLLFTAVDMPEVTGIQSLTRLRDALEEATWNSQAEYVQSVIDKATARGWFV